MRHRQHLNLYADLRIFRISHFVFLVTNGQILRICTFAELCIFVKPLLTDFVILKLGPAGLLASYKIINKHLEKILNIYTDTLEIFTGILILVFQHFLVQK